MAMGGLETVDLGFSDLYLELKEKKKKNSDGKRMLLDGSIRGRAQPGYVDNFVTTYSFSDVDMIFLR